MSKVKKGDRIKVYGGIEPVFTKDGEEERWYWCNGHTAKVLAGEGHSIGSTVRVVFDGRCSGLRNCAIKGVESLVHIKQLRKIKKKVK